jgi:hypothetical protein
MSRDSSQKSIPPSRKGFGVAASPLNQVKMELGVVLFLGFVLWLAADSITASITTQLLLLFVYGLISACWLVYRTRRVLERWKVQQWDEQENQETESGTDKTAHPEGRLNK